MKGQGGTKGTSKLPPSFIRAAASTLAWPAKARPQLGQSSRSGADHAEGGFRPRAGTSLSDSAYVPRFPASSHTRLPGQVDEPEDHPQGAPVTPVTPVTPKTPTSSFPARQKPLSAAKPAGTVVRCQSEPNFRAETPSTSAASSEALLLQAGLQLETPEKFSSSQGSTAVAGRSLVARAKSTTESAKCCMFFDWDDTLFPSSFVHQVVMPCLPRNHDFGIGTIKPDTPFYKELTSIARSVEEVLRAARKLGSVGIITLAKRPWVSQIAAGFLPGLNLPALLHELQIPVLYARECLPESACRMGTPAVFVRAKKDAMRKCVKQMFGMQSASVKNFVSIGDAEIELYAVQQLVSSLASTRQPSSSAPFLCKTVKLIVQPSIAQLQKQLDTLIPALGAVVSHEADLGLDMMSLASHAGLPDAEDLPEDVYTSSSVH